MNKPLKPYMVSGPEPSEGAVLVFAHTARKARRVGSWDVSEFGVEWIDIRARLLPDAEYFATLADQDKLGAGLPHCIVDVPHCVRCELWGKPISDGICTNCATDNGDLL